MSNAITWMSNSKEVRYKPRLHVHINLLAREWPPSCAASPPSCLRAHDRISVRNSIHMHGFPLISCMGMELRYKLSGQGSIYNSIDSQSTRWGRQNVIVKHSCFRFGLFKQCGILFILKQKMARARVG